MTITHEDRKQSVLLITHTYIHTHTRVRALEPVPPHPHPILSLHTAVPAAIGRCSAWAGPSADDWRGEEFDTWRETNCFKARMREVERASRRPVCSWNPCSRCCRAKSLSPEIEAAQLLLQMLPHVYE